jgi:hypothetical protein
VAREPSGPVFPVHVDERELVEDLQHATEAGRSAIESMIAQLKTDGVPKAWLGQCDAEARDGTRLAGCAKLYIPRPNGRWGAVFLGGISDGKPTLFLWPSGNSTLVPAGARASTRSPIGGYKSRPAARGILVSYEVRPRTTGRHTGIPRQDKTAPVGIFRHDGHSTWIRPTPDPSSNRLATRCRAWSAPQADAAAQASSR